MSCNICEDDFGHKYCACCTYRLCHNCANKITDHKCPQCKRCMKVKYFMAGKIEKEDLRNRIFVFSADDRDHYDRIMNELKNSGKHFFDHHEKRIKNSMNLKDFENLSIPMKQVEEYNHILVGPCAIFNGDVVSEALEEHDYGHGTFTSCSFNSLKGITQTLNKRNREMIEKCDVFCLVVDASRSCYRSFAEWGIALALGKVLILSVNALDPELYLYAQDSLDSFEKLPYDRRDVIIKSCPDHYNNNIGTYAEYKKILLRSIELKGSGGYAFESD